MVLERSRGGIIACMYLLLIARNLSVEICLDSVFPEQVRGSSRAILTVTFQGSLMINTLEWTLENFDSFPVTSKVFFQDTSHIT